jgi:hypothetical protein
MVEGFGFDVLVKLLVGLRLHISEGLMSSPCEGYFT